MFKNYLTTTFRNTSNAANTVNFINKRWESLYPDNIFKAMTLDEYISNKAFYLLEDVMYQGFKIVVVLSLVISRLGLSALVLSAAPVRYLAMKSWLDTFKNRITLNAGYFVIAFVASLIVAGITVSFQAKKSSYC